MKNVELTIQRHLVIWVRATYPNIKIAASQNEHSHKFVDLGMDVGEPDLRLCKRVGDVAHFLYLELKRKDGALSGNQKKWNADFDANWNCENFVRDVAYGFIEAKEKIGAWVLRSSYNL
jgi:hypothetical protein